MFSPRTVALVFVLLFIQLVLLLLALKKPPEDPSLFNLRANINANSEAKIRERDLFLATTSNIHESAQYREFLITSMPAAAATLLSAYHPCLWTIEKVPSVKTIWDGGKWTCGLRELGSSLVGGKRTGCVVYSFGSNGNDAFEQQVAHHTFDRCEVHVFDPTSPVLARWRYHSYGLGSKDGMLVINNKEYPGKCLETIMHTLGHAEVDILKFDVEGSEWDVLRSTPWEALRFGQILFEVHGWGGDLRLGNLLSVFSKLEKAGYRLFSIEPVCSNCMGQMEMSWIHQDWAPEGFIAGRTSA